MSTTTSPDPPQPLSHAYNHPTLTPRLSLPLPVRLFTTCTASFLIGAGLGGSLAGSTTALRFRAENAHRQPQSAKGWYFYHKTKNYQVAWGAIKGGIKGGARLAAWVAAFVVCEDAVDRLRGRVDAVGSVVAGLAGAGAVGVAYRLTHGTFVRTAKKGLLAGLAYGLVQDFVRGSRGQGAGVFEYVGWKGRTPLFEVTKISAEEEERRIREAQEGKGRKDTGAGNEVE
ncbi:hypothetical protein EX30DRAFT_393453 [Ascodesmis nigricans]|uniref:Tim17-domain-containing protein n=1 Tax=Ascodesmis nigricans TaxID=341454 RepID=A0A4S2N433_9PEZI|nr:hypothetical protein EX30DRAFT_393453 [Ascodesmis nigricans]